ncbi:FAD-binding protein [Nonomuraea sp. N2-4H]|uniref:FAD-binding protein n=1 Tax=Nonomuraea sp. N2-4H TaxID=3128898 RepID=UPI00324E2B7E
MTAHEPLDRLTGTLRRTIGAGRVTTTGPDYEAARHIGNGAAQARPAVIVRRADPADAQAAVRAAREAGVPLPVRGGGHDWAGRSLSGRFGLALDNLLSAGMVLACGSLTADAEHEPDPLWALRGGGGNFGVVTSMRVRPHAVPVLLSGMVLFPWEQAGSVPAGLDDVLAARPDELTVQSGVLAGPDGKPLMVLAPTWSGDDAAAGERALSRLDGLGTPLVSQAGPTSMAEMLAGIGAQFPFGRHVEIRTRSVPSPTPGVRGVLAGSPGSPATPVSPPTAPAPPRPSRRTRRKVNT